MSVEAAGRTRQPSIAYQIFILVLTLYSLLIMVALLLPLGGATSRLLMVYDNLICGVFLVDFILNLARAESKREYLIERRGWLDLLGSIPALGFFEFTALFRLARLSRLARIGRLLRGKNKRQLVDDIVTNRGQYAAFVTVLTALLVLTVCSALVLGFESRSPDATITTGGQALWWSVVTLTTVGYGDYTPVTAAGRVTGLFVMLTGVGIIAALASILASILVPPSQTRDDGGREPDTDPTPQDRSIREELEQVRLELSALRQLIAADRENRQRE